jgi:hypothetical protein
MWTIRRIVKNGEKQQAVVPEHPNANKHGYVLLYRILVEAKAAVV